ncbi:MAG: TrmH family RNA methyltransferase, partial [Myxococcota bacterium]
AFFAEGVRALDRGRARGWESLAWLYSREKPLSRWATGILEEAPAARVFEVPADALGELSDKDEPSELVALWRMPEDSLSRIPRPDRLRVVIADRPGSPGNLGALLRTCDAFGVHGLIVLGHACDPYDPRVVRASAGSLFSVPLGRLESPRQLDEWFAELRSEGRALTVWGSSARADSPLAEAPISDAMALVLGSETSGMSHAVREVCDAIVSIPMEGEATSLNVTSAAAILLHEMRRRSGATLSER